VPERLRGLVRREFLRTAPASLPAEAGYQFRHLLVRDAVYQAVPKQVRADLHERLAGLLEARAGARVREYEEIVAYQLERAGRWPVATRRPPPPCSTGRWPCSRPAIPGSRCSSPTWPTA
jgi:hypothetical protein